MNRRHFLHATAAGLVAAPAFADPVKNPDLSLASFRFDVTPPKGHSLCGGWIKPVSAYDDSLDAIGFVLLGQGEPVVICSVDWTGILNDAHVEWRTAMAEAAGTTPDRVALHCVHQHNAPLVCLDAARRTRHSSAPPRRSQSQQK